MIHCCKWFSNSWGNLFKTFIILDILDFYFAWSKSNLREYEHAVNGENVMPSIIRKIFIGIVHLKELLRFLNKALFWIKIGKAIIKTHSNQSWKISIVNCWYKNSMTECAYRKSWIQNFFITYLPDVSIKRLRKASKLQKMWRY